MTEYITMWIDDLPSLTHGEEIVRCRDCKYAYEVYWPVNSNIPDDYLDCQGELVEIWDYYNDEPKGNPVPPDGYCFCGERKVGA